MRKLGIGCFKIKHLSDLIWLIIREMRESLTNFRGRSVAKDSKTLSLCFGFNSSNKGLSAIRFRFFKCKLYVTSD